MPEFGKQIQGESRVTSNNRKFRISAGSNNRESTVEQNKSYGTVHEINAGHRSLSGTISCVTDRIRFLPVTMTGKFSNFNSMS